MPEVPGAKGAARELEVPREFAVPSEAPWPEDAWGINLGSRVLTIRSQEYHVKDRPDRVAELNHGIYMEHKMRSTGSEYWTHCMFTRSCTAT